jgi:C_GCAxxG_C_C family probable redox protein
MPKDHVAEAVELFSSGLNCCQAVLSVFSEELGIANETALKTGFPFGGGICGSGRICGALTGAIMVIGLKYDTTDKSNYDVRNLCKENTNRLIEAFELAHGSVNCNDLLGFDISNKVDSESKVKSQYFNNICPKFLETVIVFLEEEL